MLLTLAPGEFKKRLAGVTGNAGGIQTGGKREGHRPAEMERFVGAACDPDWPTVYPSETTSAAERWRQREGAMFKTERQTVTAALKGR